MHVFLKQIYTYYFIHFKSLYVIRVFNIIINSRILANSYIILLFFGKFSLCRSETRHNVKNKENNESPSADTELQNKQRDRPIVRRNINEFIGLFYTKWTEPLLCVFDWVNPTFTAIFHKKCIHIVSYIKKYRYIIDDFFVEKMC